MPNFGPKCREKCPFLGNNHFIQKLGFANLLHISNLNFTVKCGLRIYRKEFQKLYRVNSAATWVRRQLVSIIQPLFK